MAQSFAPPLHKDPGIHDRRRSHLPVLCRNLCSLLETDQATGTVSPMLLLPHPWHQIARPQESQTSREPACPAGSILLQVQLRWAGHVTRMEDVRMPKAVFFCELQEGKRDCGAPRKHYKDQLKGQLAQAGISHQSWEQEALDGDSWRSSVRKASCEFEAERCSAAKEKLQEAERASTIPTILHPKPSSVQSVVGGAHQV